MKKFLILISSLVLVSCSNEPGVIYHTDSVQKDQSIKPLTICYDGIEQNSFRTTHGFAVLVPRFTKESKVIPCEK